MIVLVISNQVKLSQSDHTLVVKFSSTKNQFGFDYKNADGFYQQIRIDGSLQKARFPVKESVYRRHDGTFAKNKVVIEKTVELHTDWMDDSTNEALVVALKHDNLIVGNGIYSHQGEYEQEDNEFDELQKAKAVLYEQGFNRTNITC